MEVIISNPQTADDFIHNGFVLTKRNKFTEAITAFNEGIARNPDDPNGYFGRAWAYHGLDWQVYRDQIRRDFELAVQLDPELLEETTLIPPATSYDERVDQNPHDAIAYCLRAISYYAEGAYDFAMTDVNHALVLNPNLYDAYYLRAKLHRIFQEEAAAIADFTEALRSKPDDIYALYYRGSVYYDLSQLPAAEADWRRMLEVTTDQEIRKYAQEALETGAVWGIPDYREPCT
jgi:tetratricopeptide (TPR) repeat protein